MDDFIEWAEAVVSVAGSSGMSDSTVIKTWPDEVFGPELTVGAVRSALECAYAARAAGGEE